MSTKAILSSKAKAEKVEVEANVVKIILNVMPNISYRAKSIYQVNGLGIFSGLFYIQKVTHTIDTSGFSTVLEGYRIAGSPDELGAGNSEYADENIAASENEDNSNGEQRPVEEGVIEVVKEDGGVLNE